MTTTASIQDIDAFIRLQKEKLNRDKVGSTGFYQPSDGAGAQLTYDRRQLSNYLNLPPRPSMEPVPTTPPQAYFRPNDAAERSSSPVAYQQANRVRRFPSFSASLL